MVHLPLCLRESRCIVHIDLDCFYSQVEEVRLGIPRDEPAAVQQWQGLIAVNYAARKAGVQRLCSVDEAKKLCPEIRLLHVPTFNEDDPLPRYHPSPDRATHKVSLETYRLASKKIFKIFEKHCKTLQKVGLDEAFMDVTPIVNQRLVQQYVEEVTSVQDSLDEDICDIPVDWDSVGVAIRSEEEEACPMDEEGRPFWTPTTWRDLQLAIGAKLAAEIRKEVYDTLSYTCSAGIAHSTVVAKLCSGRNKPNNQTILRDVARLHFMKDIPFTKIRNLGGKLGSEVETELNIQKASDLWAFDADDLQARFGPSTGLWLYNVSRGIDSREVATTKAPKTLIAVKSDYPTIHTPRELQRWCTILGSELHGRIMANYEEYHTWPKTLLVHFQSTREASSRVKSCAMPHRDDLQAPDTLTKRMLDFLATADGVFPCVGLSLRATGLFKDEGSTNQSIFKFFVPRSKEACPDPRLVPVVKPENTSNAESKLIKRKAVDQTEAAAQEQTDLEADQDQADQVQADPDETGQNPTDDQSYSWWSCDKCHKRIQHDQVEEHTDYHFALEIQEQESATSSIATTSSRPAATAPARKDTPSEKEIKKRKRESFFQPRRP